MSRAAAAIDVVDDVATNGAELLLDAVRTGGHIALAGGGAAVSVYEAARAAIDGGDPTAGSDWSGATIWFSDERVVPLGDEHSNAGQIHAALLDAVQPRSIEHVRTELGPAEAAKDYEHRIRNAVPGARFDLILLGLGPDGHTASLPPDGPELAERDRFVVDVPTPSLPPIVPRVSFALPLIHAAARVVFLVAGDEFADIARRAFGEPPSADVPASLVRPTRGELRVLIDRPAAANLHD